MTAGRRLMNEEQLKTWALRKLGSPRVKVELHRCHIEDAFEDALDWYIGNKGLMRTVQMPILVGQVTYPYPEDAETILDVILPASPFDPAIVFPPYILADERVPYDVFAVPQAQGLYSSLTQAIQYTETAKRVLSAEFNWMIQEARREIIVSPIPRRGGTAIVEYQSNCVTVDQLSTFDHNLFKGYFLALCKEVLGGRILGKYGSFPTAQGERDIRGADQLLNEAREEKEALTTRLLQSAYPLPIMTG